MTTGCETIKFEDIVNKMIVAVEKRKQEAKCNKIIVTNEDEIMLCLTKLGLTKILNITAPKGHAPIWCFYFYLCSKVTVKFEKKTASTGIEKFVNSLREKVKSFTHICKLCLKTTKDLDNPTIVSWKSSLCKPSNTANTENYIKEVHSDNDDVVTYFRNKANKRRSTGVFDSAGTSEIFQNTLKLARVETTRRLTAVRLVNNHLGHHITQTFEYRKLMEHLDPNYKPLGRTTFLDILMTMFDSMMEGIKRLFCANIRDMARLKW